MVNAEGAVSKEEIISWDEWWNAKKRVNEELIKAIEERDVSQVAKLLNEETAKHGLVADANFKMEGDVTPLHSAVQVGSIDIVDILLNRFAEVNAQDDTGVSPLHIACLSGNLAMVRKLLTRPELAVDLQDGEGNTPAHLAAKVLADEILILIVTKDRAVLKLLNDQNKTCLDLF